LHQVGDLFDLNVKLRCQNVKVSLKLSHFIVKYHSIKARGRVEVYLEDLVILELDGDEWSSSRTGLTAPS